MKIGRSLSEIAQELERQNSAKRDYIVDTRKARLHDDGRTIALNGQGDFPITDLALTQIGDRVGIPAKYLRRMQQEAPALLASNVNHWFGEKPERRMVRTLDGSARAFLSDRYMRVDNFQVAEAALPALQALPGLRILSCEITENRLYIKAASSALQRQVTKSRRVGDVVEAGLMVRNSEVGLGAVSVTAYAHFLVCTNGMTREGGKRWNHIGKHADEGDDIYEMLSDETREADDRALLLKVRDTIGACLDEARFETWVNKLNGLTENKLTGDPAKAIEVLANKVTLSKTEQTSVLRHLAEGGDLSQYGLMNAITRTAEDAESYDRATELETLGGVIVDLKPTEWRELAIAA